VNRPYTVVVDYAHSPDALEQVLRTLRTGATGRLVTVFSCGGDRDRAKRPAMGRIAAELSDQVVVTSDILGRRIRCGSSATSSPARRRARTAFTRSPTAPRRSRTPWPRPARGDLILIAGKGSEPCQIVGDTKVPYSDEATVLSLASDG